MDGPDVDGTGPRDTSRAAYEEHDPDDRFLTGLPGGIAEFSTTAIATLGPLVAVYSKAFLEALGAHTADTAASLPGRIRRRMLERGQARSHDTAAVLYLQGADAAAILVTPDLPDEARLALLDLDPTDPELRGRILAWNGERERWLPTQLLDNENAQRRTPGGN